MEALVLRDIFYTQCEIKAWCPKCTEEAYYVKAQIDSNLLTIIMIYTIYQQVKKQKNWKMSAFKFFDFIGAKPLLPSWIIFLTSIPFLFFCLFLLVSKTSQNLFYHLYIRNVWGLLAQALLQAWSDLLFIVSTLIVDRKHMNLLFT